MLLGLVKPSEGEVLILGRSLQAEPLSVLRRLGCLVESATAYPNLDVVENLDLHRRLVDAPPAAVAEVMAELGLEEFARRRARHLSLGNLQRLALARALIGWPEILVLDEPANGLDPAGMLEIRTLLRRLASERGVTIFMSSHHLAEVDQLADRIGIVHRGRLVEELDHDELLSLRGQSLEIEVDQPLRARDLLGSGLGIEDLVAFGACSLRSSDPRAIPEEVARILVDGGIALRRLCPVVEDLEAHFMRVTGGEA